MHSLRVTQVLEAGMSLFSCLTLPAGAVLSAVRPARSDGEYPGCNLSRKVLVEHAYCRHSRFRKALARLIHTLQRRGRKEQIIKGGCPLCGLLPRGSAGVVYVLSIRFANGEYHEYYFRGQPEKECYRVSDGVLNIYYSRHLRPATDFG